MVASHSLWLSLVVLSVLVGRQDARSVSPELLQSSTSSSGETPKFHQQRSRSRDAYVTLQYGGFLLGARVLGQSLQETGTRKDMVALCTEDVADTTKRVLQADGWTIKPITSIHNPHSTTDAMGGIFSKLHVWNMTEYERIVYLDSDVLVLSNIDHMFDCGTICAAFRHSDLFNAGILVLEPSKATFDDMLTKISSLPSYDGGDQGFLNVYFKDLVYAPMFNWSNVSRQRTPMRMPAGLNADVGPYYLNSHWNIPEERIRVIHYTLGPVKPWIWWTNFLFDLNLRWTSARKRLPQYPHHRDTCEPLTLPLFWLPYPLLALLFIKLRCSTRRCCHANALLNLFSTFNSRFSSAVPLVLLSCAYVLAFKIVPTTMLPAQAEYVFWLWSNSFLLAFVGLYCYLCQSVGKSDASGRRKRMLTMALYMMFLTSYVLMRAVPVCIEAFSRRVMAFLVLTAIHLAISQFTGEYLIRLWTCAPVVSEQ